jgi:RNA polymerase sigma-70 factor (ECF subfamily)
VARRGKGIDRAEFRRVVEGHEDAVFALCAALAGPDAEDLAQETFVRVYLALPRFDPSGPASLRTWILTIARRLCHDRAKKRTVEPAELPAGEGVPTPEDELAGRRRSAQVREEVDRLPPEQRAVIALREWAGLEYEEIAAVEQVPVGTVRSRLARAREALRAALEDPETRKHVGSV